MNFLAHAYLSGGHDEVMVGNFIADRIKGKAFENYPDFIRKGILLHRFIDFYCDHHEINRQSSRLLSPHFGKYSAVVMDVVNDYFLAIKWEQFHTETYPEFVRNFYQTMQNHSHHFPEASKMMLPYMIRQDWIGSYQSLQGISEILKRMSNRTRFDSGMDKALPIIENNHRELESNFDSFFPELKNAVHQKRIELNIHE